MFNSSDPPAFLEEARRTMSAPLRFARMFAALLPAALAACGGGSALRLSDVTPQSVPGLEADRAQRPGDQGVATMLGVAYFRANQLPQARATLDTVVERDPQNGIAAIYRGMTAESQGDFTAARASYERFAAVGHSRELKNTARQRLSLVGRRELEFQARAALAQESQLGQTPPEANTVAVMPFGYTGTNADIQPLGRGFAQLVITDLAHSRQVRVLERERMQAMLDEMRLSDQNRADPQTAARSGRLLRAATVVQGSLMDEGNILRVDAAVVNATTAEIGSGPASAAEALNRIFDIEKVLVIQLFEKMNIQLTDAERAAISQRPTQNLAAFLAWSRGLTAQDNGDFAGAQEFFGQAVRADPSFSAASQSAQQASDLQAASSETVAQVEVAVAANAGDESGAPTPPTTDALRNGSESTTPNTPTTQGGTTTTTTPKNEPPPASGTPQIAPDKATIRIVIPRP
jgi:TolB-like protein